MKRLIFVALMLLLSIASTVLGQSSVLTISNQIHVFPADTSNYSNLVSVTAFEKSGNYIFAATANSNILRSSDNGSTWQELSPKFPFGFTLSIGVTDSGTILSSASPIIRSTDNGNTWTNVSSKAGSFYAVTNEGSIVSGGQNSIYKSTDDGRTWFEVADSSILHQNSATSLFVTKKNTILMGVGGGSPEFWGIYRSTDNGSKWNFVNSGLPPAGDVLGWVVNFTESSDGTIFATTDHDGVYKSTNDGQNWQSLGGDVLIPGQPSIMGSGILASSNLGLFVANGNNVMGGGILHSIDNGITWSVLGFGNLPVGALMQLDSDRILANINGSIYILTLSIATAVHEPSTQPTGFSLSQNYPNPFNPTTAIRYSVVKRSFVTLSVYNILGQEIKALVSDEVNPGVHEVSFDGSSLPSGTYFYRLVTSSGWTKTEKMVLLK